MIKNERQYRLTKAQLRSFEKSIQEFSHYTAPADVEKDLLDISLAALKAQHAELEAEVEEYESLQQGNVTSFVADNLTEIPKLLIKARISLGLTHKELAERLKVKQQQLQRWESSEYENATIDTLKQVIAALGVETRDELFVPNARLTAQGLIKNLTSAGIPKDLLLRRLLSGGTASAFSTANAAKASLREILDAAGAVSRIFGAQLSDLIGDTPMQLGFARIASTKFKLPARGSTKSLNAYTIYAHYLAGVVESCSRRETTAELPTDWHQVHAELSNMESGLTYSNTLEYFWDRNIVILPLRDEGTFHGAVWKIRGRFVIIVKQNTPLEARSLYDLLHEVGHVVNGHVTDEIALIEDQPISLDNQGAEEETANEWAEDAIFDGDADNIAMACVRAADGKTQKLSQVVPVIAENYGVNLGALANYLAFRLSAQNQNWWGAAQNLQNDSVNPFEIARDHLLKRMNFRKLSPFDRELLMRAITDD